MSDATIVVTGASGFIAKHVIAELLRRGYRVRGTLRDPAKAAAVTCAVERARADPSKLSFAVADLTTDAGWPDAVAGADAVVHMASPFPMQQPDDADELLRPARGGTLRVLEAATAANVRRFVLTSSTVAILYGSGRDAGHVYSEADFTDATRTDLTPYIRSKTLAEEAAWTFVRDTPHAPELVAINPGFVHGPALDGDLSTSHALFTLMSRGLYPAAPKIRFPVVHVHDVATAHALALERADAAGQRYLLADGALLGLYELGQMMATELPDLAAKVPRFELPDFAVRTLALADKRMRTILPELGQQKRYTNAKARDELGIAFIPGEDAVVASLRSLRDLSLI